MNLHGKVAVVTGAGRGIGRAIALRFAAEGAKVVLAARSEDELNAVAQEIASAGGDAIAVKTDVSSEADVKNLIAVTESSFGAVDILVNNAGTMILKPLAETTVEEWNGVMNANLLGAFLCAREALPSMMERRTGRIINIGSMAGRRGYPEQGVYCTSKHGLYGLTKVLAIEGQKYGIRVNMVSPGGAHTKLGEPLLATRPAEEAELWMSPEEVADAVLFVATQDGPAQTDEIVLRRFASEPWR